MWGLSRKGFRNEWGFLTIDWIKTGGVGGGGKSSAFRTIEDYQYKTRQNWGPGYEQICLFLWGVKWGVLDIRDHYFIKAGKSDCGSLASWTSPFPPPLHPPSQHCATGHPRTSASPFHINLGRYWRRQGVIGDSQNISNAQSHPTFLLPPSPHTTGVLSLWQACKLVCHGHRTVPAASLVFTSLTEGGGSPLRARDPPKTSYQCYGKGSMLSSILPFASAVTLQLRPHLRVGLQSPVVCLRLALLVAQADWSVRLCDRGLWCRHRFGGGADDR